MPYSGNVGRYSYSSYGKVGKGEKATQEGALKKEAELLRRLEEGAKRRREEERKREKEREERSWDREGPRVCRPSSEAATQAREILFKRGIATSLNDRNHSECKKRLKEWLKKNHPDRGGDADICKEVNAAFDAIFKG